MALEFAVEEEVGDRYPFAIGDEADGFAPGAWTPPALIVDWAPALRAVVRDARAGTAPGVIAARFHNMLVEAIVAVAARVGEPRVVLTGGCFQNRHLAERAIAGLRAAGFRPYWHQRVPPNDGGISLGQVAAVARLGP
jgi:hydrogenase maturation protein HypF